MVRHQIAPFYGSAPTQIEFFDKRVLGTFMVALCCFHERSECQSVLKLRSRRRAFVSIRKLAVRRAVAFGSTLTNSHEESGTLARSGNRQDLVRFARLYADNYGATLHSADVIALWRAVE